MTKIRKNLSDTDMLALYGEDVSGIDPQQENKTDSKADRDRHQGYLSDSETEKLHRALLELKLALYKQGIVDYKLKISQADHTVVVTAIPVKGHKSVTR